MKSGDSLWFSSEGGDAAIKWIDNKAVHVLTNCHDPPETVLAKRKQKSSEKLDVNCPIAEVSTTYK